MTGSNGRGHGAARLRAAALLLAALLVGVLAGVVLERARSARGPGERPLREAVFYQRLDLTAEQRSRVEAIIDRRRAQAGGIWADARGDLVAVIDSATAEVRAVLTPEQRERFDRMVERQRRRTPWMNRE